MVGPSLAPRMPLVHQSIALAQQSAPMLASELLPRRTLVLIFRGPTVPGGGHSCGGQAAAERGQKMSS